MDEVPPADRERFSKEAGMAYYEALKNSTLKSDDVEG
jgi:hypothetical protein